MYDMFIASSYGRRLIVFSSLLGWSISVKRERFCLGDSTFLRPKFTAHSVSYLLLFIPHAWNWMVQDAIAHSISDLNSEKADFFLCHQVMVENESKKTNQDEAMCVHKTNGKKQNHNQCFSQSSFPVCVPHCDREGWFLCSSESLKKQQLLLNYVCRLINLRSLSVEKGSWSFLSHPKCWQPSLQSVIMSL